MGVVYRAIDRRLGREVALKVTRQSHGEVPARHPEVARARLRLEARAMAGLSHPNVVPLFAIESVGSNLVIAMEYVPGETLAQWLASPRTWQETLAALCEVGKGLAAAHAAGVVHRDVKPHNVLVGEDGRVRVTDFGLAALLDQPVPVTLEHNAPEHEDIEGSLTQTGMSVGTPAYMALEQHTGGPVDARTDQFGFCATLYEALFGVRPFIGTSALELACAKRKLKLASPVRGAEVPVRLRRAVVRGLAPRPDDRYASMEALLTALRTAASRKSGRSRAAVAVGFVVSLGLAFAMAPAAASQGEPTPLGRAASGTVALRVPGVLTKVATLSERGHSDRAQALLDDAYFAALAERRFVDAARAAEILARLHEHAQDEGAAQRWRRHATAARARLYAD